MTLYWLQHSLSQPSTWTDIAVWRTSCVSLTQEFCERTAVLGFLVCLLFSSSYCGLSLDLCALVSLEVMALLISLIPPANTARYSYGLVCLSVCLSCSCSDTESSFSVWGYVFRILGSSTFIKVMGSRSRSREQQRGYASVTKYRHSRGGPPSIARQACFTARAAMLARYICRNSVCLSVALSVCLPHACFVTNPNNALRIIWYHMKGDHSSFLTPTVASGWRLDSFIWNLRSKWPPSKNDGFDRFPLITYVPTVRDSVKSSIMTNRKWTTGFPTSYRLSAYVTPVTQSLTKQRYFVF